MEAAQGEPTDSMRAVLARLAVLRGQGCDRYAMPFPQARAQLLRERAWWLEDAPAVPTAERIVEGGTDPGRMPRRVLLRDYLPGGTPSALTRILYLHGGGWCVGSVDTHDAILRRLALATGSTVHGLDYSLAPEHPFPAAAEDVRRVLADLRAAAPVSTRWVLAGDSAGASLALVEALRARDAGERPVDALLLYYGCYLPVSPTASMRAWGDGRFGLSQAALSRYQRAYLGERDPDDVPAAFPFRAAMCGLPPVWLAAAELDPLHDDSVLLHEAIVASGGCSTLRRFPGIVHGFLSYARMLPDSVAALDESAAFVRAAATGAAG